MLAGETVEVDYVVEEEVRVQLGDRIGVTWGKWGLKKWRIFFS